MGYKSSQVIRGLLIKMLESINLKYDNAFKGIWAFRFLPGKNAYKTVGFFDKNFDDLDEKTIISIFDSEVPIAHGSIGIVSKTKKPFIVYNSFEDPKGNVVKIDYEIKQKNAIFYPLVDSSSPDVVYSILSLYSDKPLKTDMKSYEDVFDIINTYREELYELYQFYFNRDLLELYKSNQYQVDINDDYISNLLVPILSLNNSVLSIPVIKYQDNDTSIFKIHESLNRFIENLLLLKSYSLNNIFPSIIDEYLFNGSFLIDFHCKRLLINENFSVDVYFENNITIDWLSINNQLKDQVKSNTIDYNKDFVESDNFKFKCTLEILNNVLMDVLSRVLNTSPYCYKILYKRSKRFRIDSFSVKKNSSITKHEFLEFSSLSTLLPIFNALNSGYSDSSYIKYLEKYPPIFFVNSLHLNTVCFKNNKENEYCLFDNNYEIKFRLENVETFDVVNVRLCDENNKLLYSLIENNKININILIDAQAKKIATPENENYFIEYYISKGTNNESEIVDNLEKFLVNQLMAIRVLCEHKKSLKHARKAAKSAIMSRNMSHNLGSHIMFYLKNKLENVSTLIDEGVLMELCGNWSELKIEEWINVLKRVKENNNIELPFLIGIGRFINYIQERQDFLATIATGDVPYFIPQNFKDSIFDELNCDYKALRHEQSQSYKNGCKNIILSYISKSEGYERDNISINFGKFDGLNDEDRYYTHNDIDKEGHIFKIYDGSCEGTDEGIDKIKRIIGDSEAKRDLDRLRNLEVSFPGGMIGRHAFFSIVENIIRNSAKHSKKHKKLVITIDAKETADNQYVKVKIKDNLKNWTQEIENIIKTGLKEDYINDDGSIAENYKGLKEMRISAAWLRNIVDDEDNANPPILSVDKDNNNNIEYTFYLEKPWRVALITDNKALNSPHNVAILSKNNWEVFRDIESYKLGRRNHRIKLINERIKKDFKGFRVKGINEEFEENVLNVLQDVKKLFSLYISKYKSIVMEDVKCKLRPNNNYLPVIYIKDKTFLTSITDNVEITKSWLDKYGEDNAIVFKDHFENDGQLTNVYENENAGRFIESISGANSTSRLIRNETLNKEWWLKMVESCLLDILIIDERLWHYYSEIDERNFNFCNQNRRETTKSKALKLKNVYVCNIIPEYTNSDISVCFGMTDYFGNKIFSFDFSIVDNGLICNGIIMTVNNGNVKNKFKSPFHNKYYNKFNYISIHMSLYDKIRDALHKYGSDFEKITTQDVLVSMEDMLRYILVSSNVGNILVHTGKSKPSTKDLKNRYKYIPFASIENAIKDCKYSLTEVLTAAK